MTVLMTGFEPFGGETENPSWEAVSALPETIDGARIVKRRLPVEYVRAPRALEQAMAQDKPDVVICVGQAGGRTGITPEYVAINVADAASADNAGQKRAGERLIEDAPDAYFTTLPVREMVASLRAADIPASLSYTAGAYVCNCVMFHALYAAKPGTTCGFIHVPFSSSQTAGRGTNAASLPLGEIVRGLEICVRTAVRARGGRAE